jgi:predicted DNA-binding transcriptional regulator YafY
MSEKKTQQERHRRLCERFSLETSSTKVLKLSALALAFEVSNRTINQDKSELEAKGAPFKYNGSLRGWYFERPYYLHQVEFSQDQMTQLYIGLELMGRLGILQTLPELKSALSNLNYRTRERAEKAANSKQIYFDPIPPIKGSEYLPLLLHAIEENRQIQFIYEPFHAPESKIIVFDPYFLRYFDRRWYLGGLSHAANEGFVRTFPLDRVTQQPEIIGFAQKKTSSTQHEQYWSNIYGISIPPGAQIEEVVLALSPLQGQYFINAPFFEPFKIIENTGTQTIISMNVIINIELVRKLASYGAEVRVEQPHHLREQMQTFFRQALT